MQCQECGKRPATLHFTKIVNGEKTEFHICEACAREKGELIPGTSGGFSIHNLLSGLMEFHPGFQGQSAQTKPSEPLRCEECGLTYAQFSKIGRFGCSSCYKYFNNRLDPLFKRVHGNTVHVGKVPKRVGAHIQAERKIEDLRRELQDKIVQEEFEEAAALRDQIRELEKKLSAESN
ncbi:UvrB/UvrC motif-containing protein [Paenibacillus apis]|uniref:Protein-arginine kinase activator protein n=1 Tax=Paenibacillus apis TaxID=1792174 RepID=A0A920CQ73_9BACL|nr:UvrB/UvrC motif-containing protein [Paenibacillus apis]GIO45163.1 protein-arginine kinase activator protein [Paenibacillus apis]